MADIYLQQLSRNSLVKQALSASLKYTQEKLGLSLGLRLWLLFPVYPCSYTYKDLVHSTLQEYSKEQCTIHLKTCSDLSPGRWKCKIPQNWIERNSTNMHTYTRTSRLIDSIILGAGWVKVTTNRIGIASLEKHLIAAKLKIPVQWK